MVMVVMIEDTNRLYRDSKSDVLTKKNLKISRIRLLLHITTYMTFPIAIIPYQLAPNIVPSSMVGVVHNL